MDYSQRAALLRTGNTATKVTQAELQREIQKEGLTRRQYWQSRVKSRADVEKYFQLYHPSYTDEVCKALAITFEAIVASNGTSIGQDRMSKLLRAQPKKLTRKQRKALREQRCQEEGKWEQSEEDENDCNDEDEPWDLDKEVQEQRLQGLINRQMRSIEELMLEETLQQRKQIK